MPIVKISHTKKYTVIDNASIRDRRLSFKARGLHHLLLSYPDNWEINTDHLVNESERDGKEAVRTGLLELKELGYMQKVPVRDKLGKIVKWETHVFELPQVEEEEDDTETQNTDFRVSGESETQNTDFPQSGKPTIWKTQNVEKPESGKSDCIINNNNKKYLNQRSTEREESAAQTASRKKTDPEPDLTDSDTAEPSKAPSSVVVPHSEGGKVVPLPSAEGKTPEDLILESLMRDVPAKPAYVSSVSRMEARFRAGNEELHPWRSDKGLLAGFVQYLKNTFGRQGDTEQKKLTVAVGMVRNANFASPGEQAYERVNQSWLLFLANAETATSVDEAVGLKKGRTRNQEFLAKRRAMYAANQA